MSPSRFAFVIVAAWCLLRPSPLAAQDGAPPFVMEKQYSADMTVTTKGGTTIQSRNYVDGDKMRSEMSMNGMDVVSIVRQDKQKIYQVMVSQKMVMEMPFDPDKFKGNQAAAFGPEGKFELIGPETMAGIACTKYKVISTQSKQSYYFWLDVPHKVPIAMAAVDGSFTVSWKNYKIGPQDAALFEPPAGYQVVPMPEIPTSPSGGQ